MTVAKRPQTPVRGRKRPPAKVLRPKFPRAQRPAAPPPFRCVTPADHPELPEGWVRTEGLAARGLQEMEMRGVPALLEGVAAVALFSFGRDLLAGAAAPPAPGAPVSREQGWFNFRTRPSEPFGHPGADAVLAAAPHIELVAVGGLQADAPIPLVAGVVPDGVRVLLRTEGPLAGWLRTEGLAGWLRSEGVAASGAPELEAFGVPEPLARAATLILVGVANLVRGGARVGNIFDLSPSGLPAQCALDLAAPRGEAERDDLIARVTHWTVRGAFDPPGAPR